MSGIFSIDTFKRVLGWDVVKEGSQYVSTCPACGKPKIYIDPKKSTYNCKYCDASGNAITALSLTFEKIFRPALTKRRAMFLAKKRGLHSSAFLDDPLLGYDEKNNQYVWLIKKPNGKPAGYRKATYNGGRFTIRSLKGLQLYPLGFDPEVEGPVYLVEGEWDRAAGNYLLRRLGEPGQFIGIPGASTNLGKPEWIEIFKGRDVIFTYDNDAPGISGVAKNLPKIRSIAKSAKALRWDDEIPDGYDLNDMVKDNRKNLRGCFEFIAEGLEDKTRAEEEAGVSAGGEKNNLRLEQEALEPISVEELHKVFKRWMHLESCDLLDIVMGCLRTIPLQGNPIWLFIASPPSGSKTETLMPVSAWWPCHAISTATEKSLISGFQTAGGGDPSLFAKLNGNPSALIIKDLTPLLEGRESDRDAVFGIFRDAYDGSANKIFGNGVVRNYDNLHFTLIAGVTPAIDSVDSVAMGERFLKFRADKELGREDDIDRALRAIENTAHIDEMKKELTDACLRCLANKYDPKDVPDPSDENLDFKRQIAELAFLCAHMRAVAPSDKFSDKQTMSPLQEAPPRLATQFTKLAQGLAMHFGLKTLNDERILQLIRRVALHTPDIITTRIIQALYNSYNDQGPATPRAIGDKIKGLSRATIFGVLEKLARTGACETSKDLDNKTEYRLSESLHGIITRHQLFESLPKNDPLHVGRRLVIRQRKAR